MILFRQKLIFISLFMLGIAFNVLSQTNEQTERMKFGGIADNADNLIVLDKATSSLYYQHNYMIKREGVLYLTNKEIPYTKTPIELLD